MYILIKIETNDLRNVVLVSKSKMKLENYIKKKGFSWSEEENKYIDDRAIGFYGGSGVDYLICSAKELI